MTDVTHTIRIRFDTSDAARAKAESANALRTIEGQAAGATQKVSLLGRAFSGLSGNILETAKAMSGFTAAFAALASVRVLAGFDDQLATVQSVLLATEGDMAKLRAEALRLGTTTRFSAQEAGEGLELLARAGLSANESIGLVGTTLKLAQAENIGLASASENLVKITRGMRLEMSEAARVADVLSATASLSTTSVQDLATAFRYASAISAGFKTPVEEVAAALGVLADAGQDASIGGTAVRGFLSRIAAPTKEFEKDLKAIGLTLADINPETNTLVQIIEKLRDANIGTSRAFDLFKQRAGAGADILVNNIDRVKEFTEQLRQMGGTLDKKFDIKADTLINDLKLALGAVQGLIIALGDAGLTRVLRTVLQVFAAAVRGIIDAIRTLAPIIRDIGIGFAVAFSPFLIAGMLAGVVQMVALLPVLIGLIIRAAGAMALLAAANPFTAIAVAIGLAISFVRNFGDEIGIAGTRYATLADLFTVIGDGIAKGWAAISSTARSAFEAVSGYVATAANFLTSAFEAAINAVIKRLNSLFALVNKANNLLRGAFGVAPEAPFEIGKADFQITPPAFLSGIATALDNAALDRMAREKEERSKLLDVLHKQQSATAAVAKETGLSAAAADLAADATKKQITEAERMFNILEELNSPAIEAARNIAALNELFAQGSISAGQFSDQLQRMRDYMLSQDQTFGGGILRGLNKVAEGATRLGEHVEKFVVGAFSKASDAIATFATTGKFDFKSFINSILSDLIRLTTNQLFGQLAQGLLGSALGGSGGGFGNSFGGLFGFATGGSFVARGSGGTDSQNVGFAVSPGERVDILTPQQQRRQMAGGGNSTEVNVYNAPANTRTERRRDGSGNEIVDVIIGEVDQQMAQGRFDNSLGGRFGQRPRLSGR